VLGVHERLLRHRPWRRPKGRRRGPALQGGPPRVEAPGGGQGGGGGGGGGGKGQLASRVFWAGPPRRPAGRVGRRRSHRAWCVCETLHAAGGGGASRGGAMRSGDKGGWCGAGSRRAVGALGATPLWWARALLCTFFSSFFSVRWPSSV